MSIKGNLNQLRYMSLSCTYGTQLFLTRVNLVGIKCTDYNYSLIKL